MLSVNVGLLGHVDCGKTSLARALSQTASTAAFDKSPQSQARGITLDLGFSASVVRRDNALCGHLLARAELDEVRCTLVDCPGHASLIKTVIGGASIIDVMMLVIDVTKGIQAQTSECIVLGEVLARPLLVVLNKTDLIRGRTADERAAALARVRRRLAMTFAKTRWPRVPMVAVSAAPRLIGEDGTGEPAVSQHTDEVLPAIVALLDLAALREQRVRCPARQEDFFMLVDHCFSLRGQGTVFTGTILGGTVALGDDILLPELAVVRRVKGLQVFHRPVTSARRGDRVGLCVTQFDHTLMERGVMCSATVQGVVNRTTLASAAVALPITRQVGDEGDDVAVAARRTVAASSSVLVAEVVKIKYHTLACDSHTRFHVTLGHATVMATMRFFSRPCEEEEGCYEHRPGAFDLYAEGSTYLDELNDDASLRFDLAVCQAGANEGGSDCDRGGDMEVNVKEGAVAASKTAYRPGQPAPVQRSARAYYAILLLERPLYALLGATLVAMRLDIERENFCRIALAGRVVAILPPDKACLHSVAGDGAASSDGHGELMPLWRSLPIVRYKSRELRVDRVLDARSCIATEVVAAALTTPSVATRDKAQVGAMLHAQVQKFIGLKVYFEPVSALTTSVDAECAGMTGREAHGVVCGVIDSAFGKSGKAKLIFENDVFATAATAQEDTASCFLQPGRIVLLLKKYPLATHCGIEQ